ncbi:MAG: oligosaccharide flippase family protein, partial [Chloroflexota bacterium]
MRRNAGLLLAARVVSAGTTLVVLAFVAQLRGADALGAVGIGFAIGGIGAAFSDLGTSSLLVREAARRPAESGLMLGGGLAVRAVTLPLALLGAWLVGVAVAPGSVGVVVLAAAGLMLQQTAELTRSVFAAQQRMTISSSHSMVENLVWLGVVWTGLAAGIPLGVVFAWGLAVFVGSVAVGLVLDATLAKATPRMPDRIALASLLRLAAPFAGFAIVGIAYARIDPLLIGVLVTGPALATAGSFFAATRLIAAFEYLPDAVSRAIYPELSRRVAAGGDRVVSLLGGASGIVLAASGIVPAILVPGGAWLMGTLFGEQAARDGWLLGALAVAVPLRSLGYIFGVTLTSADAQTRRLLAASGALVLVVAIDVIGIPLVGLLAPVLAIYVATIVVGSMYGTFVR